ncbi:hypothetical protein [Wukongibacter sp. M2B1]|uniref:hypothetical protein n=1 Tax=Wukongibacter sp. M2B1 TaxID=3088895 RepID=UPI003D7B281E
MLCIIYGGFIYGICTTYKMTSHIKRFGEYIIDLDETPDSIHEVDIERIIELAAV